uniref:Family with sequence similarity 98 member B n=1 Tax=Strix occidentalis caurina TaxID=311401 RepID=A0A8D0FM75_STROC
MRELSPGLKMECDILDALEALGYTGPLLEEKALNKAAENGLSSPEFFELCIWLGSQIKSLCHMEESITSTDGDKDIESFQLEISGFLREMACPYSSLISGDIKGRLREKEDCLKLLLFLSTELQALKILHSKKIKGCRSEKHDEIYQEVQAICSALGLPNSSSCDIPPLLTNVEQKIKDILSKVQNNHVGKSLLTKPLDSDQVVRKSLFISFLYLTGWSKLMHMTSSVKTDDIARIYQPKRYALSPKSTITLAHLLAAREDLSKIIRTSSGSTRENTVCAINKVCFFFLGFYGFCQLIGFELEL